jgi:hypothetical protein
MRIYYRGPDAIVTSELFVRRGSPAGRFAICDLRRVGIAPAESAGVRLGAIALAAAAALLSVAVVSAVVSADAGVLVAVVIMTAASGAGAVAAVLRRRRPRRLELRAAYRGRETILYASTDARVFNQVSRALRRAIEEGRPSGWHSEGRASALHGEGRASGWHGEGRPFGRDREGRPIG